MSKQLVAALLQAAGMMCASAAGFVVALWLGLAVLAAGLVLFGLALERG